MKKILISGGAGFFGSHLCEKLLKKKHEVICVDNLFTGSLNNINHLLDFKNFKFIKHDIIEYFDVNGVDEIYNLACPASPVKYQKDPIYTLKVSVIGSLNLLKLSLLNKCKILLSSTSEVYGDPQIHPQTESYWGNVNPVGVRSCYDEGKRCAEVLFRDYNRTKNIDTKIIRIFNTYGPRMSIDDGRVISNFITQALKGYDITIYGDGSQTRSFQYIDDLVEASIRTMNSTYNKPINIGNPNEMKIIEIATLIIELTNSKSKLVFKKLPKDDPKKRKPDIDLAFNILNKWKPKTKIIDGLNDTIIYFDNLLNNE